MVMLFNYRYLVSVDSDDYLKPEAVETILLIWSQRKKISDDYAGIVSPCVSMEGNRITKNFPRNIISASLQELSYHYRCKGDKWIVVRTEILKQLKVAPIFSGEKLVGESYFWYQISPYLNFMLCEKELCVVDYQRNGYSANAYKSMFENPHGCQVEYLIIRNNATYTAARLKGMIGFISSSILIHDYKFVEKAPNKIEALLMLPFGLCWLIFLSLRKQILDRRGLELTRTSSNCN